LQPPHQFTGIWSARDDGRLTRAPTLESLVAEIKAKFALARSLIRAVALEAVVRQDRPDVALKINLFGCAGGGTQAATG
jgi:hypothetical protein